MIIEDQHGVGDVIDTGEAIGTVEEVTLRITRLDANGVTWYVRNGEIIRIGNRSQGLPPPRRTCRSPTCRERRPRRRQYHPRSRSGTGADPDSREYHRTADRAVESIIGTTMTVRTVITCALGEQFAVQRELRERLKNALDSAGVMGPPAAPFIGPTEGSHEPVRRDRRRGDLRATRPRLYEGVAADAEPALYPEADLGPAERRLVDVPHPVLRRPEHLGQERGHPRLRMRHAPYPVTLDMRDRWMRHMLAAMDNFDLPEPQAEQMRLLPAGAHARELRRRHPRPPATASPPDAPTTIRAAPSPDRASVFAIGAR